LRSAAGARDLLIEKFITVALESSAAPREILEAVRVPAMAPVGAVGLLQACCRSFDFAHAMAAV